MDKRIHRTVGREARRIRRFPDLEANGRLDVGYGEAVDMASLRFAVRGKIPRGKAFDAFCSPAYKREAAEALKNAQL